MAFALQTELFAYNRWANGRLFAAAAELPDAALDRRFDIGPGSIRETLRHIYGAERVWYQRIDGAGHETLPRSSVLHHVADVSEASQALDDRRTKWIAGLGPDAAGRSVEYEDSKGTSRSNRLADILLHVANHTVHHRAQAMAMLTGSGRRTRNLDYLAYRIAHPTVRPPDRATSEHLSGGGVDVGTNVRQPPAFDIAALQRIYGYGDAMTLQLIDLADDLDDAALDRELPIGLKTLRKTLGHICAAERNWLENWTLGSTPGFNEAPPFCPLRETRAGFVETIEKRNAFFATLSNDDLLREILAQPAEGLKLHFRLGEAVTQVAIHGTHHRAQAANMLRREKVTPPGIDFIAWKGLAN